MFQTTVRDLNLVGSDDWIDQIGEIAWLALQAAEDSGALVTVTGVEVESEDAESSYYNIKLPCGTEVVGLQGVHLVDIEDYVDPESADEIYPHGLGVQYNVELSFVKYRDGQVIDHEKLERIIKSAIASCISIEEMDATVTMVQMETDYPLPEPEDQA